LPLVIIDDNDIWPINVLLIIALLVLVVASKVLRGHAFNRTLIIVHNDHIWSINMGHSTARVTPTKLIAGLIDGIASCVQVCRRRLRNYELEFQKAIGM